MLFEFYRESDDKPFKGVIRSNRDELDGTLSSVLRPSGHGFLSVGVLIEGLTGQGFAWLRPLEGWQDAHHAEQAWLALEQTVLGVTVYLARNEHGWQFAGAYNEVPPRSWLSSQLSQPAMAAS